MTDFAVVEYDELRAALDLARKEADFLPDCSTKEGYQKSKEIAGKLTKSMTALEDLRKEIKAPVLERGKAIDSEAKAIKAELEEIRQPHLEAYKTVDAEKKRIKEEAERQLQERLDGLRACLEHARIMDAAAIDDMADNILDDPMAGFGKREVEALETKNRVVSELRRMATQRRQEAKEAEARKAEDERLAAERKALEEERRIMAEQRAEQEERRLQAEREANEKMRALEEENERMRRLTGFNEGVFTFQVTDIRAVAVAFPEAVTVIPDAIQEILIEHGEIEGIKIIEKRAS